MKLATLTNKTADETEVERDTKIRKRLKAIFNRPESSFESLRAYHDYEELLEDLVYNLVHGIKEEESNAIVERYRAENADSIPIHQSKRIEEERRVRQAIEDQRRVTEEERQRFVSTDRGEKLKRVADSRKSNTVELGDVDESLSATLSLLQQRTASQATQEGGGDKEIGAGRGASPNGGGSLVEGASQGDLASGSSASVAAATAPGVARGQVQHNAFFQFVGQRVEPRVDPNWTEATAATYRPTMPSGAAAVELLLRQVGGYDRTCELERNRAELRACIKVCR